jgi:D-alanyl-D-alanine dipeptidase
VTWIIFWNNVASRHSPVGAVDEALARLRDSTRPSDAEPGSDFKPRRRADFYGVPDEAVANRRLLRETMERHGLVAFESEWWHYDFRGREKYELLDVGFGALR